MAATEVPTRYACAHVAALRAAAALLAARAARRRRPAPPPPEERLGAAGRGRPRAGRVGDFFAAGAAKRAAAEAGSTRAVTEREADDLVRDADRFLGVVEQALGLAPHRRPSCASPLPPRQPRIGLPPGAG